MSSTNKCIKPCVVLLKPLNFHEIKTLTPQNERVKPPTKHENSKRRTKNRILSEILESEETYVKQLETIKTFFIEPIKERNLLSIEHFETLFGNFNIIHQINLKLLEELRVYSRNNVAVAFSKIAPFLKLYSLYASEFKKSLEILQNSQKENVKFSKFVEMQETRPEVQSKLSALLIAPIQRVPRYKLLLQSLFNCSLPTDSDYISLLDSLSKVEEAAFHINKIIKERENMQRLIELQRCLQPGEPNVITPSRNLIREGVLMKILPNRSKKTYLVLTNDIIMFCKMKKDEVKVNSLKCLSIYPLHKCKIIENNARTNSFELICQDQESIFYHESSEIISEWFEAIQNAIQTFLDNRKTLRKESSTRRPVKRKDLSEYNEIGLSPGRKLRKRQSAFCSETEINVQNVEKSHELKKRRGLHSYVEESEEKHPLFVNLRPPSNFNSVSDEDLSLLRSNFKDNVFVFGSSNPNRGFSFKMNQWFGGIGGSVKKFFGFK